MEDVSQHLKVADVFRAESLEAVNLWIGDEKSVSSCHKGIVLLVFLF